MKTNNNIPAYRFQGYTDAWKQRKLGEVVYRSNITSSSKVLPRLEFEDINSGLGTLNKDIFQKVNDDRKGLEFNEGDVLFGKLRPYLKNWWYAEFNGIALGDFWNLKSDVWHSCFLYTYIQSNAFQLVANDTSGTKMPRSDWNLVAKSIAKFPTLPEQSAIGTFFSTLDSQITLHQRKLDMLKEQKKTYLKLLFPAKGQTKPALRFQGFEDDWEEVKLGEVCTIQGGNAWKSDSYSSTGEYLVVTIANVTGEYFIDDKKGNRIDINPNEMQYVLKKGDILISLTGNVGRVSKMTESKGVLNQRVGKLTTTANFEFIFSILRTEKFENEMRLASQGAAQANISNKDVLQYMIPLPSLPEQEAIGTFFQTLDQEMAQVEDKLASLKEMKKTLLRKFFVS